MAPSSQQPSLISVYFTAIHRRVCKGAVFMKSLISNGLSVAADINKDVRDAPLKKHSIESVFIFTLTCQRCTFMHSKRRENKQKKQKEELNVMEQVDQNFPV